MKTKETTKEVKKEKKEVVCESCKGTGRGTPNGVNVTVCKECKGTGK